MLQRFNWVCQACKGANPNRLTMVRSVLLHFLTTRAKNLLYFPNHNDNVSGIRLA